MGITFEILGRPGHDNALFVRIDSGQSIERLLFDCGESCLHGIAFAEIQAIDHLFFSHLHMDHVGGFDYFFRCVFDRLAKPNVIWGPPDTGRIMQHRFQGFLWNLQTKMTGTWRVHDIVAEEVLTTRFELAEAFAVAHREGTRSVSRYILEKPGYVVEAHTMDHKIPTIAYVVRETPRRNIDTNRLKEMGLQPGPWLKQLKELSNPTGSEAESASASETVSVNGVSYAIAALRQKLVVETPGDSIAYLTDFYLDEAAMATLSVALKGCTTVVCESQYRHADFELARKNFHMTTVLAAELARRADVGSLVLFHLSDRYRQTDRREMLTEARSIFANTFYSCGW